MSQTVEPKPVETKEKRSSKIGLIVAIALGVGVGSWMLWTFWKSMDFSGHGVAVAVDQKPSETPNDGNFRAAVRFNRQMREQRLAEQQQSELDGPDFVHAISRDGPVKMYGADVKGGKTKMTVQQVGARVNINASSADANFLPADVRQALKVRQSMANNVLALAPLNLTEEQKAKLLKIPQGAWYPIDGPTRKKIEAAFAAWHATGGADKAKEKDLIALARELDANAAPKALKDAADRAAQVNAILTAEQKKTFAASAGG